MSKTRALYSRMRYYTETERDQMHETGVISVRRTRDDERGGLINVGTPGGGHVGAYRRRKFTSKHILN